MAPTPTSTFPEAGSSIAVWLLRSSELAPRGIMQFEKAWRSRQEVSRKAEMWR